MVEVDDKEDFGVANKINIDPVHKYGGINVWTFPEYFEQSRKHFQFFMFREKLKLGIDFPNEIVLAFGWRSIAHDKLCIALTDNHHHFLAQRVGESHKALPKSYLLPCYNTTYVQPISNSVQKEVFGELFEILDQAINYKGDLQSIAGNEYPSKIVPSICFSVQKCDKAVEVKCGLNQPTMWRLADVMLGPSGGHVLFYA